MGLSDNIAVVALVVSLVALLIAVAQMLGQFFATAEGYRRCSPQVVGPILLHGEQAENLDSYKGDTIFRLRDISRPDATLPAAVSQANDILRATLLVDQTKFEDLTTAKYVKGTPSKVESGASHAYARPYKAPLVSRAPKLRVLASQTANQASWLMLLQGLHHARSGLAYPSEGGAKATSEKDSSDKTVTVPSRQISTEAAVTFVEWTWDLMPGDIMKPLASSTLGAVMVFAFRLGMQWRSVDMQKGPLAEGNDASLTFLNISGMGWVARYSDSGGRFRAAPRLTPGSATDKLMFCIIPGAACLVDQDFECCWDDRSVNVMFTVLEKISTGDTLLKTHQDFRRDAKGSHIAAVKNEAVALLCEYLPTPESSAVTHYFWGWEKWRLSILHSWEGRYAIWKYYKDLREGQQLRPELRRMFGILDRIQRDERDAHQRTEKSDDWDEEGTGYAMDFYHLPGYREFTFDGGQDGTEEQRRNQKAMLAQFRVYFDETTNWFR